MTDTPIAVGDTLHGYCGGIFGRDHYTCCTVEARGRDWLVARDDGGNVSFAAGRDSLVGLRQHRQHIPAMFADENPCCIDGEDSYEAF